MPALSSPFLRETHYALLAYAEESAPGYASAPETPADDVAADFPF